MEVTLAGCYNYTVTKSNNLMQSPQSATKPLRISILIWSIFYQSSKRTDSFSKTLFHSLKESVFNVGDMITCCLSIYYCTRRHRSRNLNTGHQTDQQEAPGRTISSFQTIVSSPRLAELTRIILMARFWSINQVIWTCCLKAQAYVKLNIIAN